MRIVVVADPAWASGLSAELPEAEIQSIGPGDEIPDSDVLVATHESALELLEEAGEPLPVPTVWAVDRTAGRSLLDRLAGAAPRTELLFAPVDADAVARAVRSLLEGAERQDRQDDRHQREKRRRTSASMEQLWARFRGTMLDRLERLEQVGADLLEGKAGAEALAEAERAAHKLHGSLGTFGMNRGSELAAELEALVEDGPPDSGGVFRFSELVVELREVIESGTPAGDEAAGPEVRAPSPSRTAGPEPTAVVLIVEADGERTESLVEAAVARGWRPEQVPSLEEAVVAVRQSTGVAAAIIDPGAGGSAELEALLDALGELPDPPPALFHSRSHAQEERLRAARMGVQAFVEQSAPASEVLDRAESLMAAGTPEEALVLAVDDDPSVLQAITFILRGAAFRVRTLEDPLDFWETLESVEPDLLLLDIDMPGVSGYQLCRAVRADPRWSGLPVVFMTAQSEPGAVIAGFEAGGDDYLVKPVIGPELTARVEGRLQRAASDRQGAWRDGVTGLLSRRAALERLAVQVALAGRHGDVLTLALLELGVEEGEDGEELLTTVADVLRDGVRPEDVVARTGPREILIGRYGESEAAVRRWLERIVPPSEAGHSLGTAAYPSIETPEALVEGARSGMSRVHRVGRAADAVGPEGAAEAGPQAEPDIVVVEDDEALAELLLQTLDDRGYRTHWIRDGQEASELLTGSAPALQASLIILDVGLPGVDGLTLLRRLRRDGVTRRTNVLMLTARSGENEVVRALELGAFDHVPKPFSVAELLHRVRRAVESKKGS